MLSFAFAFFGKTARLQHYVVILILPRFEQLRWRGLFSPHNRMLRRWGFCGQSNFTSLLRLFRCYVGSSIPTQPQLEHQCELGECGHLCSLQRAETKETMNVTWLLSCYSFAFNPVVNPFCHPQWFMKLDHMDQPQSHNPNMLCSFICVTGLKKRREKHSGILCDAWCTA